ncbi:MAG: hypothetical protein LAO51_10240 [Acidobacteriia bacterium]|nr:hypothetical protein [Terriglobia bacterium]
MIATRLDELVWELEPEELPDALRLLAAMELAGWVSPPEASEWRGRIAALGIYHEDSRLWIDRPEA